MKSFQLDDQQHATVIAALRHYQHHLHPNNPTDHDQWISGLATNGGTVTALDGDEIDDLIDHLHFDGIASAFLEAIDVDRLDADNLEVCGSYGAPTDDGEGYDGLGGACADKASCATCGDELGEDSYEGLCNDCADNEVEKMSRRGMAANPKPIQPNA